MPSVSIVIRCLNESLHIGRLLDSVLAQTVQDVEIIVVDSGSTDGTLRIVSHYPVNLLSIRPEEFSFGRSLNIGCRAATGEFIAIVSAHVHPQNSHWLENLLSPFDDPDVALVYGKQRGDRTSKYSETQLLATWFPEQSDLRQPGPFCNNANAAIRSELWKRLPYDEELTGLEDMDWAKRARDMGHQVAYVAEAGVVHAHDESAGRIYNRYCREAIALKRVFPEERFSLGDFGRLFLANVLSDYYHAVRDRVLVGNLFGIPAFRLMQSWGAYRGFAQREAITSDLKRTFYYPNSRTNRPPEQEPSDVPAAADDSESR